MFSGFFGGLTGLLQGIGGVTTSIINSLASPVEQYISQGHTIGGGSSGGGGGTVYTPVSSGTTNYTPLLIGGGVIVALILIFKR